MRWSRAASEPALFFPKQLTVVFKQMLASHLMIFLYVLWGPSYLAMFFSVHIEAYLYTAPTVCIITSPEAITTISYLIHCLLFHSFASFTFTLALSLSLPLNTGHFSKYARLVRIPLLPIESGPPFLCLLFTSLSGSISHLLLNFIYTDLRLLCVIFQLSAGWPPLFCR